ncbi:MAG TPA: hypothetical protein VJB36_08175, partial [Methylomirabilota bacterium]|nr:hypothetical protein [Methylomirabilota bacterium]
PGWWRRRVWIHLAVGLATVGVAQLLLSRAFTAPGSHYPFDAKGLLAIGGFCAIGAALTRGSGDQRLLKMMFGAYATMAVVAYAVSSPLGGNAGRLLLFMGTPLILLPLAARGFRPRGAAALIVAATVSWQTVPVMTGWSATASARAPSREFWFPVEAFLDRHADPSYRVEVVATSHTWEAYYLARRGVPLARGWYRQDDWPENAALYKPLTIPGYHAWLRRMAVRYVLVPNDPLDTFTLGEVDRIRNGPGLDLAARVGGWSIYELRNPTPIATPRDGARVRTLTAKGLTLAVSRPGTYRLRLRYTPYWRVSRGVACVAPRGPFDTELRVAEAGTVRLDFRVGARTVVRTALGAAGAPCDDSGRPAAVAQRAR